MNRVSDERLDEWIEGTSESPENYYCCEVLSSLRELRDFRKAVREYFEALDKRDTIEDYSNIEELRAVDAGIVAAEATLRALQERT